MPQGTEVKRTGRSLPRVFSEGVLSLVAEKLHSKAVVLTGDAFPLLSLPAGDTWPCLETFLMVRILCRGGKYFWHLVDRGQGCN